MRLIMPGDRDTTKPGPLANQRQTIEVLSILHPIPERETMNPETIKQVIDSLEKNGAAALDGIAANAVMQAWGHFFVLALLLVITGGLVWFTLWLWRKAKEADIWGEDTWGAGAIVSGFAAAIFLVCFIVGLFEVPDNIATIKNPRAAAIRLLLQR